MVDGNTIIGLIEDIDIMVKDESKFPVKAKIDTGATKSSIDTRLASELKLGPIVMTKLIKSAHGNSLRPVVAAKIRLDGKIIDTQFTLADRKHMKYKVLIGVNTLRGNNFLVDPSK